MATDETTPAGKKPGEGDTAIVEQKLERLIELLESIEWESVPGLSTAEAAAFTQRLDGAREDVAEVSGTEESHTAELSAFYEISHEDPSPDSLIVRSIPPDPVDGTGWEVELEIGGAVVDLDGEAAISLATGVNDVSGRWFVEGETALGVGDEFEECNLTVSATAPHAEEIGAHSENIEVTIGLTEEQRDQLRDELRAAVDDPSFPSK